MGFQFQAQFNWAFWAVSFMYSRWNKTSLQQKGETNKQTKDGGKKEKRKRENLHMKEVYIKISKH